MKYLISFLLLALVAVQAYPSEINNEDLSFSAWDEILTKIKQFIDEAKKVIANITTDLKELYKKIKDKIEEIASIESVDDMIKIIIQDLTDMLEEAGIKVKPECITEQMDTIKNIAIENRDAALKCANEATGKLEKIQQDASKVKSEATNLLKEASKNSFECTFKPLEEIVKCLTGVFDNLKSKSQELTTQIGGIMDSAKTMLADLNQCQQNIKDNFFGEIDKVYEEIVACSNAS